MRQVPQFPHQRRFVAFAFALLVGRTLAAEDWTGFQCGITGVHQDGVVPLNWGPAKNLVWKIDLTGYGQSSPVTWGSQVYVTSISGAKKERCHVTAIEFGTGKQLWQHHADAASQAENNNYLSRAAPSPTVDEAGVYCLFEGGNLMALSHDGTVRWNRNLVQEFGEIESRHGVSASLEQSPEHLFVWIERQANPYVLAVEKSSGKDLWKVPGLGATSWASPRLIPVEGGSHLVLSGIGSVAGLDPKSGTELWRLKGVVGNSTPTPVPAGTGRFLLGATQGRGEADSGKAAESNGLIAIRQTDAGTFQADYVWRSKRSTSSFGSPLMNEGLAYFVNATGVLFCHDLETGEERYSHRLADSIWATPVAVGNRLYFFGKGGSTSVISTGPAFNQVAENSVWDAAPAAEGAAPRFGGPVLYAGIYAHERWLLRRGDVLYCIGVTE